VTIATIGVVDDDPGMLRALTRLLRSQGYTARAFASAEEFLEQLRETSLDCAVLDLSMPGINGLELQDRLRRRVPHLPVLFLTGKGDIPASVRAIKAGAVHFLTKPVDKTELLNALRLGLIERTRRCAAERELTDLRRRFGNLTAREVEVLRHVVAGRLNKQIAADLGVSEQTVKVHRMHITEKTGLPSVAELVRATERLGIEPIGAATKLN
jgi:FixJ family two-component response regulator